MSTRELELMEQARWVLMAAQKFGAKDARITVERSTESSFDWRDGKVDGVKESTSFTLTATLYVDGRFSSNSTSDMRKPALEKFLQDSIALTKALAPDPNRVLPDPSRYANRFSGDLAIRDSAAEMVSPEWRRKTAIDLEKAARSVPNADKIVSVSTNCSSNTSEWAKVNSNGMDGTNADSSFSFYAEVSVRDANGKKPSSYFYSTSRLMRRLASVEEVGRKAALRALQRIGAKARATGEYGCVVEAMVASRLSDPLFSALDGGNIQQKRSFLAGKIGETIASPLLTIVDTPHVVEGLGSRTFDGEGMNTRPRTIFENGVLRDYYLDTYYAKKLGLEPTSSARTNLIWKTGSRSLEALLEQMETGILVTGFNGGNSNAATGDFSFGIQGQWVEAGKIVGPLSEMNLSGNHLTFWKNLVELGNDKFLWSSNQRPSFRFEKVQFSGT